MIEIELRHKVSTDLMLFLEFAGFISDQLNSREELGVYGVLNSILQLYPQAGSLQNRLSRARQGREIFKLSAKRYTMFCNKFIEVFSKMPLEKQREFHEFENSFYQWKNSIDLRHKLTTNKESERFIEKEEKEVEENFEIPTRYDQILSNECSAIFGKNSTRFSVESIETLEFQSGLDSLAPEELHLLSALKKITDASLVPGCFTPIETEYICLLIESFRFRFKNEHNLEIILQGLSNDTLSILKSFHIYGWQVLELFDKKILHQTLNFTPLIVNCFGFRCGAITKVKDKVYLLDVKYDTHNKWLSLIGDSRYQFDDIEIMSFPLKKPEAYCLGHKVIFNIKNFDIKVVLVLLKNTFSPPENVVGNINDKYENTNPLEIAYLEHPKHMAGTDPFENLHLSVKMLFDFYHLQFPKKL